MRKTNDHVGTQTQDRNHPGRPERNRLGNHTQSAGGHPHDRNLHSGRLRLGQSGGLLPQDAGGTDRDDVSRGRIGP